MGKLFQGIILIVTTSFLTGCGNLNSIHHFLTVDEGTGAMVDIKQRAIIVSKKKIEKTDAQGYSQKTQTIVCAEPSPDALSAYAAELAAEGGIPGKVSAKLAGATQESAAFVGLRTQSIQLLRDSLYRLCEGYMSGALTKTEYGHYTRRYQRFMIALLGIEQLTGAIRAPSVTIRTEGKAQTAAAIADLRKEVEKINEEIQEKTKSKDTLMGEQKAEADEGKKQAIQKEIDAVGTAIKEKEADKKDIERAITEERKGLVAEGSATASVSEVGLPTSRSDAHIQHVGSIVENIVLRAMDVDDLGPFCWDFLINQKANEDKQGTHSDSTRTTQAGIHKTLFVSNQTAPPSNSVPPIQEPRVEGTEPHDPSSLEKICLMRLAQNDLDQEQARNNNKALFDLFKSNLDKLTPQERVKTLRPAVEQQQSSDLPELSPKANPVGPVSPWRQRPYGPTLAWEMPKHGTTYGWNYEPSMHVMNTIQSHHTPQVLVQEYSYVSYDAPSLSQLKTELAKKYSNQKLGLCSFFTYGKVECLSRTTFTIQEMSEDDFEWLVSVYKGPTEQFRFLWTPAIMPSTDSQTGK